MAKAFKWLLPGAVKKMTTKKNNKIKQNIRKETKKVQQRSDIQPFLFHSNSFTAHIGMISLS